MRFEFDPAKSAKNEQERGLPLNFPPPRAGEVLAKRAEGDYGEIRVNTLGEIEGRIVFASFTRREDVIRIISFRKANARETKRFREHLRSRSEGSTD